MPSRHPLAAGLVLGFLLAPAVARADTDAEQRAAKLFETGRALARDGHCPEAIPVLLESLKEAPGVGPLLNLGLCHAATGKTLAAYQYYVRAAELARSRHDERAAEAEERARTLEARLSSLTVRVVDPTEPGLALRLDGEPFDRPQWGAPRRIDPGAHVLEASSPRRGTVTLRVTVGSNANRSELVVPALAATPAQGPSGQGEPVPSTPGGTQRTVGWIVGGAGATAVAAGAVFGILSMLDHSSLVDKCASYPNCPKLPPGQLDDLNDSARTKGTVSTIAVAAGAALVAGGLVLLWTAPHTREVAAR